MCIAQPPPVGEELILHCKLDGHAEVVANAGPTAASDLANVIGHRAIGAAYSTPNSLFDAARPPRLSLNDYAIRLREDFRCSDECFVLALVYVDRVLKRNQCFTITALNTHRLLMTSLVLAVKLQDDAYFSNKYYASAAGIDTEELNQLERQFLSLIGWQFMVSPQEYSDYHAQMLSAKGPGVAEADVDMLDASTTTESSHRPTVSDACTSEIPPALMLDTARKHAQSSGLRVSPPRQENLKLSNCRSCSTKRRSSGIWRRTRLTKKKASFFLRWQSLIPVSF